MRDILGGAGKALDGFTRVDQVRTPISSQFWHRHHKSCPPSGPPRFGAIFGGGFFHNMHLDTARWQSYYRRTKTTALL